MDDRVWLVVGCKESSWGWENWVVAVHTTQEEAEAHVELLTEECSHARERWRSEEDRSEFTLELDPFNGPYGGQYPDSIPTYSVQPVVLVESVEEFREGSRGVKIEARRKVAGEMMK